MARKKKGKKRKVQIRRAEVGECVFCKRKKDPSYKEYDELTHYLTDRARIMGRIRSGLCSKHQRRLTIAIKRARHLGLLPHTPSL